MTILPPAPIPPRENGVFSFPAIVLALSILFGSTAGKYVFPETGRWIPFAFPFFGMAALATPTPAALAAAGIMGGIILEYGRSLAGKGEKSLAGMEVTLEGKVIRTDPQRFGRVNVALLSREILWLERSPCRANLVISVPEADAPPPGALVRVRAAMADVFPGASPAPSWRGTAVEGSVQADPGSAPLANRGRERLAGVLDGSTHPAGGFLGAISLGQRWRVPDSMGNALRRTGTYHLLAVSGVHLASALLPVVLLVRLWTVASGRCRIGWRALHLPVLGSLTLWVYLSLTGLATSALRASVFVSLAWIGGVFRRLKDPLSVLAWCVTFIVCVTSRHQPDLSLLLSAAAVLGILLAASRRRSFLGKICGASTGALLFTLPVSTWCSGGIPLASPVCNVAAGILFGSILIPFAVIIVLAACLTPLSLEPAVRAWLFLAGPGIEGLCRVSSFGGSFLVLSRAGCMAAAVCGLAALAVWRKRSFGVLSGLALFIGVAVLAGCFEQARGAAVGRSTTLSFPRVGQADAAILRSGGRTVLIDTGGPAAPGRTPPVVAALSGEGVRRIDAVFLTHAHPDHVGCFADIARRWRIEALYLPEIEKDPGRWSDLIGCLPRGARVVSLSRGDQVGVGTLRFVVLGPSSGWTKEMGENAGSLQIHVQGEGLSALFTGDAPWDQVGGNLTGLEFLNLLKVPHHGSREGFPGPVLGEEIGRLRRNGGMVALFPSAPPREGSALPASQVVKWFEERGVPCEFSGTGKGASFRVRRNGRTPDPSRGRDPRPFLAPLVDITPSF